MDLREERDVRGHTNLVGDLAFSPDGRRLASAGADGRLLVWDVARAEVLRAFELPPDLGPDLSTPVAEAIRFPKDDEVQSLSPFARFSVATGRVLEHRTEIAGREASADGRTLLGGWGRTLRTFALPECRPVGSVEFDDHVCAARLLPDGRRVAVLTGTGLEIHDPGAGTTGRVVAGGWPHGLDGRLAVSPDGSLAAVERGPTPEDRVLEMRVLDGGAVLWTRPGKALDLCFSPDGRLLAASDDRGLVRLVSVKDGGARIEFRLFHEPWIRRLAFSPDGAILAAAADDGVVRLFKAGTGAHLADLGRATVPIRRLAVSPVSPRFCLAAGDGRVACRRLGSPARDWEYLEAAGEPAGLDVAAEGRLVFAGDGRRIHLLDAATGQPVGRPLPIRPPFHCFAAAPDGRTFATGHADGRVAIRDTTDGTSLREYRFPAEKPGAVLGLAFSSLGHVLALAGRETRVLDAATGESLVEIPGEWRDTQAAFSRDGRAAAVGDWLGGVELFRTFDWLRVGEAGPGRDGVSGLSLAPDGRWWASGTAWDNDAFLGRTKVRKDRFRLVGHTNAVVATVFTPDGGLLLTGSKDGTVRFWNARSGRPVATLDEP